MSMPGFVFHIICPACNKFSPEYPLYVFPSIWDADLFLPAWSRTLRGYAHVSCALPPEDRRSIEQDGKRLAELARQLSSPALTVGVPIWLSSDEGLGVRVEPSPECPACGHPAQAVVGYPPREPAALRQPIGDPYSVPLPMLQFSVRATHCLESAGVANLGELCKRSAAELLAIRGFTPSTLEEIREKVRLAGCRLSGE